MVSTGFFVVFFFLLYNAWQFSFTLDAVAAIITDYYNYKDDTPNT